MKTKEVLDDCCWALGINPIGKTNQQKAKKFLEQVSEPGFIPNDLAREGLYRSIFHMEFLTKRKKKEIIREALEIAPIVFLELVGKKNLVKEDVSHAYHKAKREQKQSPGEKQVENRRSMLQITEAFMLN